MSSEHRKRRKITLYNGDEVLDVKGVDSTRSVATALRLIKNEFEFYPVMTHAVMIDLRGKNWQIHRHDSFCKRLKTRFTAA